MIHGDNPFMEEPEHRDPVRRFRGRLAAPVTIVTTGTGDTRAGLTVSSLMVVEGEPGTVQLVVGPTSDLWHALPDHGSFIVHVCRHDDRHLAEVFAGLRPSPGGPFSSVSVTQSKHGATIDELPDRAFCRYVDRVEVGYSGVVTGEVEYVEAADIRDPLVYFRGSYRSLA